MTWDRVVKWFVGTLMALMVGMVLVALVGCSGAPVKCPDVPKCPPSYAEAYLEEQAAADRLEDALRAETDRSRACVRVFEDSLRKSK
jgi:hypothetical protein